MAALVLAQRRQLETKSTALLNAILGLDLCPSEEDKSPAEITLGAGPSLAEFAGWSSAQRELYVARSLRGFYEKLPYNSGAQNVLQDLLSVARMLARTFPPPAEDAAAAAGPPMRPASGPTSGAARHAPRGLAAGVPRQGSVGPAPKAKGRAPGRDARVLLGLAAYLREPEFTKHLADFGNLPGMSFILVFDQFKYQHRPPPPPAADPAEEPPHPGQPAVAGSSAPTGGGAGKEAEMTAGFLDRLFGETLPVGNIFCEKCHDNTFVKYREVQTRSSDEGSVYIYFCSRCKINAKTR
jgi:Transcription factor S-II (TFIIS)